MGHMILFACVCFYVSWWNVGFKKPCSWWNNITVQNTSVIGVFLNLWNCFPLCFKTDEGTSVMVKLGGIVICLHQRLTQRKQSCHWRKLVGCWLCWLWSHWLDTEEESSQRLVQLTMRLHLYRTWESKLTFSCYLVKVVFLAHVCGVVSLTKL